MKNPNRYGTVTKLSGNRRRPWVVKEGLSGRQRAIGYAATKEEGLILLAQYNNTPWDIDAHKITLQELYEVWLEKRCVKLGKANQANLKSAYKHCIKLGGTPYAQIKAYQMQDCIDNCGRGYSTQGAIKNLWGHLDRFGAGYHFQTIFRSFNFRPNTRHNEKNFYARGNRSYLGEQKPSMDRFYPVSPLYWIQNF